MTTSILTSLMRLGAEIFGSNEDLTMLPNPKDDQSGGGDGESDDTDDDQDGDSADGSGESGDDQDDGDADGSGESGDDTDGDDTDGKSGESGDDQDGDSPGGDDQDDGDSPGGEPGESGKSGNDSDNDNESGEQTDDVDPHSDKAAGGFDSTEDFQDAMIDGLKAPTEHIKDAADALAEATDKCRDEDDVRPGEQVWRPYNPEADLIVKPKGDRESAEILRKEAKLLTAALRTQFRRRFLAAKNPREQHGVRRGKDLSERRLVESFVEIKSGIRPSRPDYKIESQKDVSLCLGVVIDQSGSMHGAEQHAAAVSALALAESFDSLNAPVMVCGPRNSGRDIRRVDTGYYTDIDNDDSHTGTVNVASGPQCHRYNATAIDLFMDWDESFKQVKHRFAQVRATGSTPLSDGIQFAMQELSNRPERHRIIVVLTDGCPDNHAVVTRQIRLAREAGITVIGVGISGAEYYVPALFVDHHIVVNDLTELPKAMMAVVGAIVFPRSAKKAVLDGRIGTRRQRRRA